jgi:predicted CoA-substrate-specific enzyme activase
MKYFVGVDIGSTMTKVVILDQEKEIQASLVKFTDAEQRQLAEQTMKEALERAGIEWKTIECIVATGYGRINVPFADQQISELSCHSKGVAELFPSAKTAIDIGGQDSKGMKISEGKLMDFVMNDKCAAGTGRYLELTAASLGLKVEDLESIGSKTKNQVMISSTCSIFAQQEIISLISKGVPIEDIVAGLHDAIASRVVRMVMRMGIERDVVFTGGVAKNAGVVDAIEERLGYEILVPEEPLLTGAMGGALLGRELALFGRGKKRD